MGEVENELKKMRGNIVILALSALWADTPEEQKGPLCNACINLVEQLVPSLIDPDVQQNFVDIFVAVCNLAETMLDPPDYQLAAECRYMPEVYGVDIMEFAYEGGNAPENVCGFLLGLDVLGGQTCPSVANRQ